MKSLPIIFVLVTVLVTTSFSKSTSTYNGKCNKKVIKCIVRK